MLRPGTKLCAPSKELWPTPKAVFVRDSSGHRCGLRSLSRLEAFERSCTGALY